MTADLFTAIRSKDLVSVRTLVEAGADVNAACESGMGTLLSFDTSIVEYLLSAGADPDVQRNEFGASVLAGLCYINQLECVRLLLQHGANVDLGRVESMETPLHHAIAASYEDREPLINLLIESGANVNAKTKVGVVSFNFWRDAKTRGETPLHRAAAFASADAIAALIKAGADLTLTDANGDTPVAWASWHRRPRPIIDALSS